MHGTIMVFLAVVPLAVGAFGNYLVPLMIGAPDMAFPRLNALSYWLYLAAGLVMLAGFFLPGGAAASGWTSYPPLADLATVGPDRLAHRHVRARSSSSLVGSINMIVTILQLRAPGLTLMRLPFFVWAQLVTSFLLLLAFPPLQAAAVLQLMDRLAGTSFFLPSGLVVSGQALEVDRRRQPDPLAAPLLVPRPSGGLRPHPARARHRRRSHRQHHAQAALGLPRDGRLRAVHRLHVVSRLGAPHVPHGHGPDDERVLPGDDDDHFDPVGDHRLGAVAVAARRIDPLHRAGLFALAFLPMFGIGGLTGLPLGLAATDIPLHDTYYVIGHFHYIVAPGTLFALFAGIYYWFPKVTGRQLNDRLGRIHFWGSLIGMNGIFLPMFLQGLAGMNRRLYDGGRSVPVLRRLRRQLSLQAWSAVFLGVVAAGVHREFLPEPLARRARQRQPLAGDDARVDDDVAAAAR